MQDELLHRAYRGIRVVVTVQEGVIKDLEHFVEHGGGGLCRVLNDHIVVHSMDTTDLVCLSFAGKFKSVYTAIPGFFRYPLHPRIVVVEFRHGPGVGATSKKIRRGPNSVGLLPANRFWQYWRLS